MGWMWLKAPLPPIGGTRDIALLPRAYLHILFSQGALRGLQGETLPP